MNHAVACDGYVPPEDLEINDDYCKEEMTKDCPTQCSQISFSKLECALPRCPNITKDHLAKIFPDRNGAILQTEPLPEERFNVDSNCTFVCKENCEYEVWNRNVYNCT